MKLEEDYRRDTSRAYETEKRLISRQSQLVVTKPRTRSQLTVAQSQPHMLRRVDTVEKRHQAEAMPSMYSSDWRSCL